MNFKNTAFIIIFCMKFIYANELTRFEEVNSAGPFMETLAELFQKTIMPLYGDQTVALTKIAKANDRHTYLLLNQKNEALGVLVFKRELSQEFKSIGVEQAIELKTLFVVDADKNSGKGIGSQLFKKCLQYAREVGAKKIVVTVSQEKPESLQFFKRKGFEIIDSICGKYKKDKVEFILVMSL